MPSSYFVELISPLVTNTDRAGEDQNTKNESALLKFGDDTVMRNVFMSPLTSEEGTEKQLLCQSHCIAKH